MKYALINGEKTEATKGAKGLCRLCGSELIAKCGEIKINHWAHKGERNCDPWWENETAWHRSWKDKFPIDWQEIVHFAESGEKHIADIKTKNGWVLEFQHSYLNPDERHARNSFYPKLVWVVDGLRRKRDKQQFQNILKDSRVLNQNPLICRVFYPDECRILNEWLDCNAFVFFDFKDIVNSGDSLLWLLLHNKSKSDTRLICFPRNNFIQHHIDGSFDELIEIMNNPSPIKPVSNEEKKQSKTNKEPSIYQRMRAYQNRNRKRL